MPPLGSILRPVVSRLGSKLGGIGGATYGAMTAEEDGSPALRALGYGALGGVALPMGAQAIQRGYKAPGIGEVKRTRNPRTDQNPAWLSRAKRTLFSRHDSSRELWGDRWRDSSRTRKGQRGGRTGEIRGDRQGRSYP